LLLRQTFKNLSIQFKLFERQDSTKIGVHKIPTYRNHKQIENVNVVDYSKTRKSSKVYADMKFFTKTMGDKQNFIFKYNEENSGDKNLSSTDPKSLSYSNKNQKISASITPNSENSNNFLKIAETPLCPDSSRVSNYTSSEMNKKNFKKFSHEISPKKLNLKFIANDSFRKDFKNFQDSNANLFLVYKKRPNYLVNKRNFNNAQLADKERQLVVTTQNNAHRIYYKDENLNFL
jgi:hypothetical protein